MKRFYRWLMTGVIGGLILTAGVLVTAIAFADKDTPALGAVEVLSQLEGAYESTREQTNIPVLLPTEVPEMGTDFWLSESISTNDNQYTLSIDPIPDCGGSGYCSRGSIGGEIVTSTTESVLNIYGFLNEPPTDPNRPRSEDPMGSVDLIGGVEGFFVPWIATAQCSEARVYWEQPSASGMETYRYYVGIECGDRAEVIELANNVIANTEGL